MKRLYTSLSAGGGVVGLLFGSYCTVVARAYADGEHSRMTAWNFVAVAIFGLIGGVVGLLLAAFVEVFRQRFLDSQSSKSAPPNGGRATGSATSGVADEPPSPN